MDEIKKPHPFQERVFDILASWPDRRRNIILQAPTGAGKTHAALYPWLYYLTDTNPALPPKCLYAVPMRVLANQFLEKYRLTVEKVNRKNRLELSKPEFTGVSAVEIMTGEERRDPKLQAALTFATIDQVLSSYLLTPYSLPRRQANINAGAVVASYLVFDEFHLFDPGSTLPTTLEMLHQLKGIAPFLLMTATFSNEMLSALADRLDAEIVPNTDEEREEIQQIESQQKTRRYHAIDDVLSAGVVLDHHRGDKTLVVCNTVDRARQLYEVLDHPNKQLLHSRFLSADRRRCEDEIRDIYSKENKDVQQDMIVVSTQAIEVGLDISCRTLITELAPANAIIQRAGRCARYEGQTGDVYVYNQANDPREENKIQDLRESVMPYKGQGNEVVSTWGNLCAADGSEYDFTMEQDLVSAVHGIRDKEIIEGIGATDGEHRAAMYQVMRGDNLEASDLIRRIRAYRVTIHDNPEALIDNPLAVEHFSISHSVLMGAWNALEAAGDHMAEGAPVTGIYEERDERGRRAADDENRTIYHTCPVNDRRELAGMTLIVLHPAVATYDEDLGLLLGIGGDWQCEIKEKGDSADGLPREGHSYRFETYQEHIRLVYQAFDQITWPEVEPAAVSMENRFGWEPGSLRRAAELTVLFHDVGKLDQRWQQWAHDWQEKKGNPKRDDVMAAHTDYDYNNPDDRLLNIGFTLRRPPHAGEGAYACLPLLAAGLNQHELLVMAAYTAILRHHSPFADDHQGYRLSKYAPQAIADTLGDWPLDAVDVLMGPLPGQSADQFIVQPENSKAFRAYLLLARVLRRADQLGTAWGAKVQV